MNFDQALDTYVAESRELLQDMERGLLACCDGAADSDLVNGLFRAAHTIKGSAGLFGLDAIVAFTHTVESVLDRVRDGVLAIDSTLAALLLECCDHMGQLVDAVAGGGSVEATADGAAVQRRLAVYLGESAAVAANAAAANSLDAETGTAANGRNDYWHISLRFGRDVFRNGMDPLSFIRYLGVAGEVIAVSVIPDEMPAATEMDQESDRKSVV